MQSSYAQQRRLHTAFLRPKRCQSRAIDRSVTERSKAVNLPRVRETKYELDTKLDDILNKNQDLESSFRETRNIPGSPTKSQEILEYHNFLNDFSNTATITDYKFRDLLSKTEETHKLLLIEREKLIESQRSHYRTEMGLDIN